MRAVEDLVAEVRDPRSREHFAEGVRAYNAGAYRAAIISTWVTVALDLMSKVRLLADDGEQAAVSLVAELDRTIDASDRPKLQSIETSLLDKARDLFELIDARDYDTLKRLYADRHVCAHPAFVAPEETFEASPELVRAHLAAAVDAALKHGATAGPKTLERFTTEVQGQAWPGLHEASQGLAKASNTPGAQVGSKPRCPRQRFLTARSPRPQRRAPWPGHPSEHDLTAMTRLVLGRC